MLSRWGLLVSARASSPNASSRSEDENVDLGSLIGEFYDDPMELGVFIPVAQLEAPYASLLDHEAHMTVTVEQFHGRSVDVQVHRSLSRLNDGRMLQYSDPSGVFGEKAASANPIGRRGEEALATRRQRVPVSKHQLTEFALQTTQYTREITLVTGTGLPEGSGQTASTSAGDRFNELDDRAASVSARQIRSASGKPNSGHPGRIVQYGIVRLNTAALRQKVWAEIASGRVPLGRVLIQHQVLREVQLCCLWEVTAGPSLSRVLEVPEGCKLYGRTALIRCDSRPAIELLEIVRVDEDWLTRSQSSALPR